MKRYNILQPLYMSFYSRDLYRDVASNWRGTGFLYVLMLLAICWVLAMFPIYGGIRDFVQHEAPKLVGQLPTITIKDGQVSVDETTPYFIRVPGSSKIIGIIDTSGQFTNLQDTKAQVLLTKDTLYVRNQDAIETYDLSEVKHFSISQRDIYTVLNYARTWLIFFIYPLLVLFAFVYRMIQLLIYALIGRFIFVPATGAKLTYDVVLRLASIAITPAVILATVIDFFGLMFPMRWILYLVISMIYLFFAVKSNRAQTSEIQ